MLHMLIEFSGSFRTSLLTIIFPLILFFYFYIVPTSIPIQSNITPPEGSSPSNYPSFVKTSNAPKSPQPAIPAHIQNPIKATECSAPSLFAEERDHVAEGISEMKKLGTAMYADPGKEVYAQNILMEDWDFLERWEQGETRYTKLIDKAMEKSNRARSRVERNKRLYSLETEEEWLEFMFEADDEDLPPLTKFAQSYIYERQHPKSCQAMDNDYGFVVMNKFPVDEAYGLGAVFQSVATFMSYSLRTGRTLVYTQNPPGQRFITESPECGRSLDCIFHKISPCSPYNSTIQGTNPKTVYLPATGENVPPPSYFQTNPDSVPPLLGYLLQREHPTMTQPAMKYWWRTQATAYIMRLNKQSLRHLYRLRTSNTMQHGLHVYPHPVTGELQHKKVPFTFPLGTSSASTRLKAAKSCWAVHVRHGDKGIEMALRPLESYLVPLQAAIVTNPLSALSNCAFISTEDPEVLEQIQDIHDLLPSFVKTRPFSGGFTYYWSGIYRMNDSPEGQLKGFTGEDGNGGWNGIKGTRTELTLQWLSQAVMQGEAAGWVGTRGVSQPALQTLATAK